MVAKLAEQGKLNLNAPIANYAPTLKLPGGAEYRATVGDVLSHRLGLYRNAYDNKLEEGRGPALPPPDARRSSTSICAPGTCWSYQNVAYDASSEIVDKATGKPYERGGPRQSVRPDRHDQRQRQPRRAGQRQELGAAAQRRAAGRCEVSDTYYRVPAAGGVNSNIKDMALWMIAQMGEMPDVLTPAAARDDPRAAGQDARRARAAAQVPRAARRPPITAMAGAAMIMPATASSATAAGSTAIAR